MSENWSAVGIDVLNALLEVGTTAYVIRAGTPTGPSYNRTPGTPTQHACTVVYSRWNAQQIDGTLIRVTDKKALVSVPDLDITPEVGDSFWDGVTLSGSDPVTLQIVAPLTRIAPSGQAVLYTLNLRG